MGLSCVFSQLRQAGFGVAPCFYYSGCVKGFGGDGKGKVKVVDQFGFMVAEALHLSDKPTCGPVGLLLGCRPSVRNWFDATYFAPVALIDNKEPIRELHAEGTRLEEVPLSLGW